MKRIKQRHAFTLIETLVTLSIFSLLMATLMGGLFGVTRSWSRTDESLVRNAELRAALDRWRSDIESTWFEAKPDEPLFTVTRDERGRVTITVCRIADANDPRGAAMKVTWEIRESGNAKEWIRKEQAHIAGLVAGEPSEEIALTNLGSVEFRFLSRGLWTETWEQTIPPEGIQARVELAGAPRAIAWSSAVISIGGADEAE